MQLNRLIVLEQLQRAGLPGVLGLALAVFAAMAGLSALLPARQEFAQVSQALEWARLAGSAPARAAKPLSAEQQLARFYAAFPAREQAPELLERIYLVAEDNGLEVARGEYAVTEERRSGLVSYQVLLPLRGHYGQIRGFVDGALESLPTLALDELDFARERISETRIDAEVRFSLYLARL